MTALGTHPESELLVVTGAASGIGKAVVQAAIAKGARVLALDIQEPSPETFSDDPREQQLVSVLRCDVSSTNDWETVVTRLKELGTPTHIHLNAGIQIAPPDAPLADYQFEAMKLDRYRQMMGVNVDGVVFGLQALLPHCTSGAAIVVTSSLAGITPYSVDPLYAMSKHAVSGLVRSLGPDLKKRGITINAICPGGIDTAIIPHQQRREQRNANSAPQSSNDRAAQNTTVELMTPEHVADEVLFLMTVEESGKTWAKLATTKPVYIIRAPGDKGGARDSRSG